MAKTGRYTLFSIIGVTAAVLVIAGTISYIANITKISRPERRSIEQNTEVSRQNAEEQSVGDEISLEVGVQSIEVSGVWKVQLLPLGEGPARVELSGPEDILAEVSTSSDGDLFLGYPEGRHRINFNPTAIVYSDDVQHISVSGSSDIFIGEVRQDSLSVYIEGVANLEASGAYIEQLLVSTEGAARINFMQSEVLNADVQIYGAADVRLNMVGGRLTGNIDGIGSLKYSGSISERQFDVDGLGGIEYLD